MCRDARVPPFGTSTGSTGKSREFMLAMWVGQLAGCAKRLPVQGGIDAGWKCISVVPFRPAPGIESVTGDIL
jgi:hypothetical protein